ncbi:hypothetical protein P3T73_00080 [Kiritimatiellota bacterium B12222]|nr:hypothetical protein P3T73_00080 [Kiritimatiellota bacterium B12222]
MKTKTIFCALFLSCRMLLLCGYGATVDEIVTLAEAQMSAGDSEGARAVLVAELELKPENPYLLYNMGLTYVAENELELAEEAFRKADLFVTDPELHARIFAQQGNIQAKLGRASFDKDPDMALQQWRSAHQYYQSALRKDKSLEMAKSNGIATRDGMVALIVTGTETRLATAKAFERNTYVKIDMLRRCYQDLDEAVTLSPKHEHAQLLHQQVEGLLAENLNALAEKELSDAQQYLASNAEETNEQKRKQAFSRAVDAATQSIQLFEDAASLSTEPDKFDLKIAEGQMVLSQAFLGMGKDKLEKMETMPEKRQSAMAEMALEDFQQSLAADPNNQEAQGLIAEVEKMLAQKYEAEADALVQDLDRLNKESSKASKRKQADELYDQALALNPDDVDLQAKDKENALALAGLLSETGEQKMEKGEAMLPENPEGAVTNLEAAAADFHQAMSLLEEHGDAAGSEAAAAAAADASAAADGVGDKLEEAAKTGEASDGAPGEKAGEDAQAGSPGETPPGAPGSGSAGGDEPTMGQLQKSSEQAMSLLQEARALAQEAASATDTGATQAGTPSYESISFVAEGGDFNRDAVGSGGEKEGNFNTQPMKKPARDW